MHIEDECPGVDTALGVMRRNQSANTDPATLAPEIKPASGTPHPHQIIDDRQSATSHTPPQRRALTDDDDPSAQSA
jgi:hypothetical protein